jgi:hypothetical protein
MKRSKSIFTFAGLTTGIVLIFTYCTKENNTSSVVSKGKQTMTNAEAISVVQDEQVAANAYAEVDNEVEGTLSAFFSPVKSAIADSCKTVYTSTADSIWPRVITINFGAMGCTNARGKTKSGKIVVSLSAPFTDSLSTRTITFENLTINGNKIEGTKTLQYLGKIDGAPTWKTDIVGGKVTTISGKVVTYEIKNELRSLLAGDKRFWWFSNEVFSISGVFSGSIAKDTVSHAYLDSINSSNPIIISQRCEFPQGGTDWLTLSKNGQVVDTVLVNYGTYMTSQPCKNQYSLTINGKTQTVTGRD